MSNISDIFTNIIQGTDSGNVLGTLLHNQGLSMEQLWKLPVDIVEYDDDYKIFIDVPGINKENMTINVYGNKIDVEVERVNPYPEDQNIIKKEIIYGRFKRTIIIPIFVMSQNDVNVILNKKGTLQIKINKQTRQSSFNINIESTDTN